MNAEPLHVGGRQRGIGTVGGGTTPPEPNQQRSQQLPDMAGISSASKHGPHLL